MIDHQPILDFWLADAALSPAHAKEQQKLWYRSSKAIDDEIESRFSALHAQAVAGELNNWRGEPFPALALVLLLDQFTRHLYRGTADAFGQDTMALEIAINCPEIHRLPPIGQVFLLHPFEHSENLDTQKESVKRFTELAETADEQWRPMMGEFLKHAKEQHDIIERFGRFPHRNTVMQRTSTPEELEFLTKSGKSFGQKPKS